MIRHFITFETLPFKKQQKLFTMGNPIKTIAKFIAAVMIAGFGSFFTFTSMINPSFLSHLWLPFLAIHYMMAFIIKYIHSRVDKKNNEHTRSGSFLAIIFATGITGYSIFFISMVISLCKDPYCTQIRSKSTDPVVVYTILCLFEYFNLVIFFDLCFIKFPGTRNLLYRLTVNFPASLHMTTVVMSSFFLWLFPIIAYFAANYQYEISSIHIITYAPILVYVIIYMLSINGLYNSLFTHWSYIHIDMKNNIINNKHSEQPEQPLLDDTKQQSNILILKQNVSVSAVTNMKYVVRCDVKQYKINQSKSVQFNNNNSIRICQITDPHIGPLMSVNRLRNICKDIIEKDPDLVLLTGDYYTGEANLDGLLIKSLEPLKSINYKCFACLGNHDMESDDVYNRTINELKMLGIKLLQNESVIYDKLRIGPVQIIGFDYIFHGVEDRRQTHRNILNEHQCPVECSNRRIVLLHDPGNFRHFDGDENIIVFSGHTHGGHCGIVTCGFQWTFFYQFLKMPDNGLWVKGNNKLYVHRGQGSRALYGNYVLRCGVPTEQSLVHIEW
eukprot:31935_1